MSLHGDHTGDLYIVEKIFPAFEDSNSQKRFIRQAPEIFELRHENIVRTYAILQCWGYIRILMEPMDICLEKLRVQVSLFSSVEIKVHSSSLS